jgi:hypothetical protein
MKNVIKTSQIGHWMPGIDRCTIAIGGNKMDYYIDDIVVIPVTEAK